MQTVDTNYKTTTDTHSTLKYSQSIVTVESSKAHVIEIILVAVPEGTANRQIIDISYIATQTRKSLVKGERFIRSVWIAEMITRTWQSGNFLSLEHQIDRSVSLRQKNSFFSKYEIFLQPFFAKKKNIETNDLD